MPLRRRFRPMSSGSACSALVRSGERFTTGAPVRTLETELKLHSNTVATTSFAGRRG